MNPLQFLLLYLIIKNFFFAYWVSYSYFYWIVGTKKSWTSGNVSQSDKKPVSKKIEKNELVLMLTFF